MHIQAHVDGSLQIPTWQDHVCPDPMTARVNVVGGKRWNERFSHVRLRAVRESRGLSQARLAKLVGQARETIAKYENGKQIPRVPTLHVIADVLNVDVTELLEPGPVDLAVLRAQQNLSQADVAAALGISQPWYQHLEARKARLDPALLPQLASLLKVEPDVLVGLVRLRSADE